MKKDKIIKHIKVYGIVQGVGFRPTVSRHAIESKITGSVCNRGPYVEIYACGTYEEIEMFLDLLKHKPPKRSAILKIDVKDVLPDDENYNKYLNDINEFEIIESKKTAGEIYVSPDIAICDECKEELYDKSNRRYLHPFINCTSCGPRLTILDNLPYDRHRTSMKIFPMCEECDSEYHSSESRRYDAQPVCCNDCGPAYYMLDMETGKPESDFLEIVKARKDVSVKDKSLNMITKDTSYKFKNIGEYSLNTIKRAREIIRDGKIIAVKGIGGFHLCCDGTNDEAVKRLRMLKNRPVKPFAVMMKNMDVVNRECVVDENQKEILDGYQKPILLLNKKNSDETKLANSISIDNESVGVMLPYAPVQMLLFDAGDDDVFTDILVMTSGNVSGAPISHNDEEAYTEIRGFVDAILTNNRDIRIRTDDSVMDFFMGEPMMIRRSRGYAPIPYMTSSDFKGEVLAIGGELKNTFCIAKNNIFYPSSYVGDLADYRTVKALKDSIKRMLDLLECKPEIIVCDKHPKYNSTMVAEELSEELGIKLEYVQHHYAHILSNMGCNDFLEENIGVSFDGTGYGDDDTIWGGEILTCNLDGFTRETHIKPFFQMGGDSSSKEGYKIAVSIIFSMFEKEEAYECIEKLKLCEKKDLNLLYMMFDKKMNGVNSTSMGRLFDAISAVLGIRNKSTFEGESAIYLEYAAEKYLDSKNVKPEYKNKDCMDKYDAINELTSKIVDGYDTEFLCKNNGFTYEDINETDKLYADIIKLKLEGKDSGELSFLFHKKISEMVVASVKTISSKNNIKTVTLSGGVFQNKLLIYLTKGALEKEGFKVLTHKLLPANDGGIALGQALYGMNKITKNN